MPPVRSVVASIALTARTARSSGPIERRCSAPIARNGIPRPVRTSVGCNPTVTVSSGARAAPATMAATIQASSTPNAGATSGAGRVRPSALVTTASEVRIEAPIAKQATTATDNSSVAPNTTTATDAVIRGRRGRRQRRYRADEREERHERASPVRERHQSERPLVSEMEGAREAHEQRGVQSGDHVDAEHRHDCRADPGIEEAAPGRPNPLIGQPVASPRRPADGRERRGQPCRDQHHRGAHQERSRCIGDDEEEEPTECGSGTEGRRFESRSKPCSPGRAARVAPHGGPRA